MSDEILFEQIGQWGVITLNRPKALNALTHSMVKAMCVQLGKWAKDVSIHAVMIQGEGERAFCAGGDIRWLHDAAREDHKTACEFFRDEYTNNAAIYHFPKPYIALIDGIVMGGGVGVSVHGTVRIAGDNTLFAMPETGIGLFPDVGGGYFMPRLEGGLGLYYGLTGARAKAADCLETGIATHYVASDRNKDLISALHGIEFKADDDPYGPILKTIDDFKSVPDRAPINEVRGDIERLFTGHDTLDGLLTALENDQSDFAADALKTLSRMSPTSLHLTFTQMQRGYMLDFNHVMRMEFRVVSRVMQSDDFFEGVRALIIDKDKSPKWSPPSVGDIDKTDVKAFFASLDKDELVL